MLNKPQEYRLKVNKNILLALKKEVRSQAINIVKNTPLEEYSNDALTTIFKLMSELVDIVKKIERQEQLYLSQQIYPTEIILQRHDYELLISKVNLQKLGIVVFSSI